MHAGCRHRGGDIHIKYHGIQECLQHGGDNQRAARTARGQPGLAVFEYDGGCHGGKWSPARRNRIRLALHQTVSVRGAGLGGEIVHLVVEQHAGTWHHDVRAKAEVEGVSVGDHIAVGIGD